MEGTYGSNSALANRRLGYFTPGLNVRHPPREGTRPTPTPIPGPALPLLRPPPPTPRSSARSNTARASRAAIPGSARFASDLADNHRVFDRRVIGQQEGLAEDDRERSIALER